MQIHFTKQFPWGDPSYFVEKIWSGFSLNDFLWDQRNGCWSTERFKENFPYDYDWFPIFMNVKPKIQTIREDKNNRWKSGKNLHFEQWIGKPYNSKCYHFAPVIPCMSVQNIEIEYQGLKQNGNVIPAIKIDGEYLVKNEFYRLAQNDGFDTESDFFKWFDKDYKGKIIHWTDCWY